MATLGKGRPSCESQYGDPREKESRARLLGVARLPSVNLPASEHAVIDRGKLVDYLLSASHPVGRFKAAFFRTLGFTSDNLEELEMAIRAMVAEQQAELGESNKFGQKYRVAGNIEGPSGRAARVVTVWIVLNGEDRPRMITAYPAS